MSSNAMSGTNCWIAAAATLPVLQASKTLMSVCLTKMRAKSLDISARLQAIITEIGTGRIFSKFEGSGCIFRCCRMTVFG